MSTASIAATVRATRQHWLAVAVAVAILAAGASAAIIALATSGSSTSAAPATAAPATAAPLYFGNYLERHPPFGTAPAFDGYVEPTAPFATPEVNETPTPQVPGPRP